jgi:hypothetical protein
MYKNITIVVLLVLAGFFFYIAQDEMKSKSHILDMYIEVVAVNDQLSTQLETTREQLKEARALEVMYQGRIKFLEEECEKLVDTRKELDDKLDYFGCTHKALSSHFHDLWYNRKFLDALSSVDGGEKYLKELFETWYYIIWLSDLPKEQKKDWEESLKKDFESKCKLWFHGKFVAGEFVSDDTVTVSSPEGR